MPPFAATSMKGKIALVTAAGDNLGKATAIRLAELGADLCLVDDDAEFLANCAKDLEQLGANVHACVTDISQPGNCAGAVAAAVNAFGRLDALCNVATEFIPSLSTSMSVTDWEKTVAINMSAPFYLSQAALPHLLSTGGAIVNVASCVANMAVPYTAAYAASKSGLISMTRAMAREYLEQTVRINAIAPGGFPYTPRKTTALPDDIDPAELQRASTKRGMVDIKQVADLIAFLASDASEGYHGSCLTIDNGISLG